jgi:hypothetical protein
MSHNSPQGSKTLARWKRIDQAADTVRPRPVMTLAVGGSMSKLQAECMPRPAQVRAPRGIIVGFSAAARKRMIEMMASINRTRVRFMPIMVTLTYPAVWPTEPKVWKEHLDAWLKRLERQYVGLSAIWKLEFQSRGAPHFHLLVFGTRWLSHQWCARAWYEVVDSGDERHLEAGVEVKRVRSWRGVMSYASKYLAKKTTENLPGMVGRFWGVHRRARLPFDLIQIPMEHEQYLLLRRMLDRWSNGSANQREENGRRYYRKRSTRMGGEYLGFTVLGDTARVVQLLRVLA